MIYLIYFFKKKIIIVFLSKLQNGSADFIFSSSVEDYEWKVKNELL